MQFNVIPRACSPSVCSLSHFVAPLCICVLTLPVAILKIVKFGLGSNKKINKTLIYSFFLFFNLRLVLIWVHLIVYFFVPRRHSFLEFDINILSQFVTKKRELYTEMLNDKYASFCKIFWIFCTQLSKKNDCSKIYNFSGPTLGRGNIFWMNCSKIINSEPMTVLSQYFIRICS